MLAAFCLSPTAKLSTQFIKSTFSKSVSKSENLVRIKKNLLRIRKLYHYTFHILTDFRLEKVDLKTKMYISAITASEYNTIVYVGGEDESQLVVAESYNTMDGTSFEQLISIPVRTSKQCLVIVNKTMLFMAGGWTHLLHRWTSQGSNSPEGATSKAYMYSKSR
jgi:hypothetical protein